MNIFNKNKEIDWYKLDYNKSLDYALAQKLKRYGYDPLEVIVWYYNKEKKIILFQSNHKYYKLANNKITEIKESDIWKN